MSGSEARELTLALSKGRILAEALPLLERAGCAALEDPALSRRLIIATADPGLRLLVLRAQDVPTFVSRGAADLGVAGRDVLLESAVDGVYQPLDLGIARCRMVVAGPAGTRPRPGRLRVATKYPRIAARHYAAKGEQVELIKLYGSMELAPLVGLADRIVDLVDTGNTLRANGLEELEPVAEISSRLIVNKASMKLNSARVKHLVRLLADAVEPRR